MKITSPDDLYPKRFPRKIKKKYIKAWGKDVYKGILKGDIILSPYIPKITKTILIDEYGKREILSRYGEKKINPDLYCIYKYKKE